MTFSIRDQWKNFHDTSHQLMEEEIEDLKKEARNKSNPCFTEREVERLCFQFAETGISNVEKKIKATLVTDEINDGLMNLFKENLNLYFHHDSSKFQKDLRAILVSKKEISSI